MSNDVKRLKDISDKVAVAYRINKPVSKAICALFLEELGKELIKGNKVILKNFGTFKPIRRYADPDKIVFGRAQKDGYRIKFAASDAVLDKARKSFEVSDTEV